MKIGTSPNVIDWQSTIQKTKLSTAWKLCLPVPTSGLTSSVLKEVMAMHLFLPSLACREVVGKRVGGARGPVAGMFGDEIMCANTLPRDSWGFLEVET